MDLIRLNALVLQEVVIRRKLGSGLVIRVLRPPLVVAANPVIEAVLGENLVAQMPLADVAGLVLRRDHLRGRLHLARHDQSVHGHARRRRIQPRHDRRPSRRTHRLGHVRVLKHQAALSQRVHVRRLNPVVPVASHTVLPQPVRQNEDEVGMFRGRGVWQGDVLRMVGY